MSSSCVITDIVIGMGHSGGLWLLWISDFNITVDSASHNYILATASYKPTYISFILICMYGDPHHSRMDEIW
ncbi:hypothetical protein U9M48_003091 [Paspalum notatum var. saurae]|uniref:Uncharacterized protein n=1 Tax=Paspalum notatum var. saurae TaxID=547442 RepID=A0AAQ3PKJ5_PASNO